MKVKLQGHDYELKALKEGLNKVTHNDIKFSFLEGRKIELTLQDSEGEEHKITVKFNEILKALNSTDTTKQLSSEKHDSNMTKNNKENIENILTNLDRLKDMGHENKSFRQTFYNLFRRSLPNFTREKNLDTLRDTKDNLGGFDQTLLTPQLNFTKNIPEGRLLPPDDDKTDKNALAHVLHFDQPPKAHDIKPITYEEISNLPPAQRAPHLHQHLFHLSHEIQDKMLDVERLPRKPPSNLKDIHAIIDDTNQLINRLAEEDPEAKKQLLELLRSKNETPNLKIIQAAILYLNGNDSDKKECFERLHPDAAGVFVMQILPEGHRKEALEHCNLSSIKKWVEASKFESPEKGIVRTLKKDFVDDSNNAASLTPYANCLVAIYRETRDPVEYFGDLQIWGSHLSLDGEKWLKTP